MSAPTTPAGFARSETPARLGQRAGARRTITPILKAKTNVPSNAATRRPSAAATRAANARPAIPRPRDRGRDDRARPERPAGPSGRRPESATAQRGTPRARRCRPCVTVRFVPHPPAFESVIAQIKSGSVAYSVFALARLFLDKAGALRCALDHGGRPPALSTGRKRPGRVRSAHSGRRRLHRARRMIFTRSR